MADQKQETTEQRQPAAIAKDLTDQAIAIRAEWNTNTDSPKGREATALASLLEEAATCLSQTGAKK